MEMTSYAVRRFVISDQHGLHLRPAAILAKTAGDFDSSITVCCKGAKAEAKSNNVTEFELDKDVWWGPKYGNKWVYAVEFDDDYRVIVDAKTGNTLGFATWN